MSIQEAGIFLRASGEWRLILLSKPPRNSGMSPVVGDGGYFSMTWFHSSLLLVVIELVLIVVQSFRKIAGSEEELVMERGDSCTSTYPSLFSLVTTRNQVYRTLRHTILLNSRARIPWYDSLLFFQESQLFYIHSAMTLTS